MACKDEGRVKRLEHIRGLTAPSDQQRLLLDLVDQPTRTAAEERDLAALWAAEKHQLAQIKAAKIVTEHKNAANEGRDH